MAQAAMTLMERIERGDEHVVISLLVVFEVVFLLERRYKTPKATIREMVGDVLSLRSVQLAEKDLCVGALDLYVERNIAFADAYHAVWMQRAGLTEVYSWDKEFDRVPSLTRIEPM